MRILLCALLLLPLTVIAQSGTAAPAQSASAPPDPVNTTLLDDRRPGPEDPLPEKIQGPPSDATTPAVSIRTDSSGDVVEEYRMNGQIYMVKVRPTRGVPYTLMDTNGDGRLDSKDGDGPVRPVYWTLYEWN